MSNPFPGVDPYLEASGDWPDFHQRFITYCRDTLSDCLPRPYRARAQEHIRLVQVPGEQARAVVPDAMISPRLGVDAAGAVATLEPVTIPFAMTMEIREIWIEIVRHPEQQLVAVIEVLSPDNKRSDGADRYDNKRMEILAGRVHLIEIDLLIGGRRLPMRRPLPPAHYYALVADATRRPDCDVYHWTLAQTLPTIPIPLLAPDRPVSLDLAAVYSLTYDRGHYARELDYSASPADRWSADDLDWMAKRVLRWMPET
ncbi:MAG TPA: DUF4058 family protein [Pirellulales bacterium]|nr:DUF4058 family protein [Pirellulales bacterium]